MTADTTAATATADTSAAAVQTTAETPATNAPNVEGSQATPQEEKPKEEPQSTDGDQPKEAAAPEKYEYTLPDGMEIDAALAEKVDPIFKDAKIPQEVAQKLALAVAEHFKALEEGSGEALDKFYSERRDAEIAEQSEKWLNESLAAKDIGESVRSRVVDAVGELATPEVKEAFNTLGWGNHPALIRLLNTLIDYVPPEKGERAASGGGTQSLADRMFGHLPSRSG